MNDTLSLIAKLRGQLPPEAQEQLDELEALAGEGAGPGDEGGLPDDATGELFGEGESDEASLEDLDAAAMGDFEDEGLPPEDEPSDMPVDVNASAAAKPGAKRKKPGKPSFFA